MSSRQARNERREAERKARKFEARLTRHAGLSPEPVYLPTAAPPTPATEIGFVSQNAPPLAPAKPNLSTGPRTTRGKLASSRNSLKHGLASGELIVPGEDPAAFEALLADLLAEHNPSNVTEELLVKDMAQSYWLSQRALRLQNACFTAEAVDGKQLALFLRYGTTHERAFGKALHALMNLQKERRKLERQFVSHNAPSLRAQTQFVSQNLPALDGQTQFVSQAQPVNPSEAPPQLRRQAA